VGSQIA
jgi:serine/threonine protein kinase